MAKDAATKQAEEAITRYEEWKKSGEKAKADATAAVIAKLTELVNEVLGYDKDFHTETVAATRVLNERLGMSNKTTSSSSSSGKKTRTPSREATDDEVKKLASKLTDKPQTCSDLSGLFGNDSLGSPNMSPAVIRSAGLKLVAQNKAAKHQGKGPWPAFSKN